MTHNSTIHSPCIMSVQFSSLREMRDRDVREAQTVAKRDRRNRSLISGNGKDWNGSQENEREKREVSRRLKTTSELTYAGLYPSKAGSSCKLTGQASARKRERIAVMTRRVGKSTKTRLAPEREKRSPTGLRFHPRKRKKYKGKRYNWKERSNFYTAIPEHDLGYGIENSNPPSSPPTGKGTIKVKGRPPGTRLTVGAINQLVI